MELQKDSRLLLISFLHFRCDTKHVVVRSLVAFRLQSHLFLRKHFYNVRKDLPLIMSPRDPINFEHTP